MDLKDESSMKKRIELLHLRWLLFIAPKERIEQICDYTANVLVNGKTYHDFEEREREYLDELIAKEKKYNKALDTIKSLMNNQQS